MCIWGFYLKLDLGVFLFILLEIRSHDQSYITYQARLVVFNIPKAINQNALPKKLDGVSYFETRLTGGQRLLERFIDTPI